MFCVLTLSTRKALVEVDKIEKGQIVKLVKIIEYTSGFFTEVWIVTYPAINYGACQLRH